MALNLKTLGTRSLSAAVFVVVLIGSVLWNYYSFTLFFFIVAMLGLNEFYKIAEKLQAKPYKPIGFISGIIVYLSQINFVYFVFDGLPILCSALLVLVPFLMRVSNFRKKAFLNTYNPKIL